LELVVAVAGWLARAAAALLARRVPAAPVNNQAYLELILAFFL